jgi:electron transport complex protein RnfC
MGDLNSMLNKLKRAALGAHTPHDKATAASKPIPMPLPAQVRILMSQHIGAPAKALVKKGDEVFVGTKIGEAGGFVSANIHSSVSGTVAAVEPFRLSNGRMCDSVVIKTDGKQTVDPAVKAPEVTDKASFLKAVRECGLVGLGGAGFPTDVKLQPKQQVDTLLINASECEVWLTSDTQEMLNCSDDIIRGIKAVLQYTGIPKCVIGIENNKPECIDLLCKKTNGDSTIEVKPLPSVYGTGAELILIEKCLGREVPHGRRHRHERDQCFHAGQVSGDRYAGGRAHHHRGRRRLRKAPEHRCPRGHCLSGHH